MIEFRYLPAFFAVASHKNFTKAGKNLHISTSAVSRQIHLLEEASGIQLFFRSPREVRLTPAGEQLFAELNRFSDRAEQILDEKKISLFKIGALQGVLQYWFVDLIGKDPFFKDINLEIKVSDPTNLLDLVEKGEIEATFLSTVYRPHIPSALRIHRLFPEKIVLISKHKIDFSEIDNHTWICFSKNSWLNQFQKKDPSRYIIVNHMNTIVELVRLGKGISMVPSYMIKETKGLYIQSIHKFTKKYICLVTRRFEQEQNILHKFIDIIKENASDWKEL